MMSLDDLETSSLYPTTFEGINNYIYIYFFFSLYFFAMHFFLYISIFI